MAEKNSRNPDYTILKVECLKEIKVGLEGKQVDSGQRSLSEFLRPFLKRIVSGEIKL